MLDELTLLMSYEVHLRLTDEWYFDDICLYVFDGVTQLFYTFMIDVYVNMN